MDSTKLNPYFQKLSVDYLYHLGFDSSMDLPTLFGNVEYVILTRSFNNADRVANEFVKKFYSINNIDIKCKTIGKNERYHIHKVHNTLIVSHGIGSPSLMICLNEIVKLLWHANVKNPKFFRIGQAGGIGLAAGELLFATEAVDHTFKPTFENIEFGETYYYPTPFNLEFTQKVAATLKDTQPIFGKTIGGVGYYTGQARMNGATQVSFTREEQQEYLKKAVTQNIKSFDLEALGFAAFCHKLDIPACQLNVILGDRFESDKILIPKKERIQAFIKASHIIIDYILNQGCANAN